jgi:hypothetical protein
MALGIGSGLAFSSANCGCSAAKIVWNNTQTGNSYFRMNASVFTGTPESGDTIQLQCNLRASVPFDSDGDDVIGFNLQLGNQVDGTRQVPFDGSTLALDRVRTQTDWSSSTYIFSFAQAGSTDRPLANSYILLSDVIITVKDDEDNVKQIITPDFSECGSVSDIVTTPNNGTMSVFAGSCD